MLLFLLILTNCSTPRPKPPPLDPDLALYNSTARIEFSRGTVSLAANSYTKALDRARVMDDAPSIASAAYNLAICRAALSDYMASSALLDEAEHELLRSRASLTDLLLARARISLLQQDTSAALRAADESLHRPESRPSDDQRLQAHVIAGLAASEAGDTATAGRRLSDAAGLTAKVTGAAALASVTGLAGDIHLRGGDFTSAAADFDREAELRRSIGQYRELARALAKSGRAHASAGNQAQAADRLYRAARAAVARHDPDAQALAVEATTAANAAGDEALARLSAVLAQRSTTKPALPIRTIPIE